MPMSQPLRHPGHEWELLETFEAMAPVPLHVAHGVQGCLGGPYDYEQINEYEATSNMNSGPAHFRPGCGDPMLANPAVYEYEHGGQPMRGLRAPTKATQGEGEGARLKQSQLQAPAGRALPRPSMPASASTASSSSKVASSSSGSSSSSSRSRPVPTFEPLAQQQARQQQVTTTQQVTQAKQQQATLGAKEQAKPSCTSSSSSGGGCEQTPSKGKGKNKRSSEDEPPREPASPEKFARQVPCTPIKTPISCKKKIRVIPEVESAAAAAEGTDAHSSASAAAAAEEDRVPSLLLKMVDSIACGDASPRAAAKALGLGLAQLSPLSRAMCEGGLGKFTQ